MKKTLALLLILVTLIPMVLITPVSAAATKEPFYVLSWTGFDSTKHPYLYGLPCPSVSYIGENPTLSYNGATIRYGSYTDADVTKVAEAVKARLDIRPAGARYLRISGITAYLKQMSENVIFLDYGVEPLSEIFSAFFKKMAEINCPLDGVVLDIEYFSMSAYYLSVKSNATMDCYATNKQIFAEIVKNPQYKKRIRPLLEEYGFPFWPNPAGEKSEIFSIYTKNKGAENNPLAQSIWNTVVRVHQNRYINELCYEPLKAAYPDATLSDYQSLDSKSWMKIAGVGDDGITLTGGNSVCVGTTSTYSYYFAQPKEAFFEDHDQYASFNDAVYESSPFNCLLYEVNFTRHMYASSEAKKIAPWVSSYLYSRDKLNRWNNTAYYSELLYHLGMFNPQPFLHYNTKAEVGDKDGSEVYWEKNGQTLNAIMAALTEVAGYSDRKPIELPQYWNAEYVVSGIYANGRNIWRITPNTDEVSLKAFKVKDSDPTFSVKGQTITFPGGKILKDANIPNVGSCGYWVETKANVTPVMTADADRYAKYPSFLENFDSYANGALTADKMTQDYAWEIQGSAKVANKALSLTGNVTFRNIEIPAKITAGDSFAKHQTWEMTVTVPSGLANDAEIYLLKYAGKGGATDGGIKIAGGKVYYSDFASGTVEYQELATVNPGTYTLKRVMNFSNSDEFSYDIYLLDSRGKEITNSKSIVASTFTAITSISFSTKNANKAVSVDNYKLYPSGLAADFELYDATTGKNILGDEIEQARSRSTAYRLSWLNGTDSNKTVTVVAAIYEGGNLKAEKAVKTLAMKPGHDGVDTGVVEVKAGQSIHVYLKNGTHQDVTYTEPDATESGNKPQPTENNSKATSATKATTASSKATSSGTKATQPTKVTKVPTRASRPTKATKPGQTLAPDETLAPEETNETLAPEETLVPDETLAPTEAIDTPIEENKDGDNSLMIIVIAAVAVLAVAGGLTFFSLKKKKPAAAPEAPDEDLEDVEDLDNDPEA